MPEVTVVIPLYNKGNCISRALDSVFNQTFKDFELIVVNDGSTDDGPSIVQQCKDTRVKIITQKNFGPGAARNRGMCEASTPYVAFLDADDEWTSDFLEISFRTLKANPNAVLTTALYWINRRDNLWKGYELVDLKEGIMEVGYKFPVSQLEYLIGAIHAGGTVLCRKDILQKYGGFYENRCLFAEDQYLWLQVVLNHPVYIIKTGLMIYHKEDSGLAIDGPKRVAFKPMVADSKRIRQNCPLGKEELLEDFLGRTALEESHNLFRRETVQQIRMCLKMYPKMKSQLASYCKLICKLMLHQMGLYR